MDDETEKPWDECRCECHNRGTRIIHCMPCCSKTYQKYLDEKGNPILDWEEEEKE